MTKQNDDSVAHFFGGGASTGSDDELNLSLEPTETDEELEPNLEGEIAVDVYQTDNHVVIVSPIAGVDPADIEIGATDDTITISGERQGEHTSQGHNLVTQEIYWGAFSRTVTLPVPCAVDKASAAFKHGILTVSIPKTGKEKKRVIKVKTEQA